MTFREKHFKSEVNQQISNRMQHAVTNLSITRNHSSDFQLKIYTHILVMKDIEIHLLKFFSLE